MQGTEKALGGVRAKGEGSRPPGPTPPAAASGQHHWDKGEATSRPLCPAPRLPIGCRAREGRGRGHCEPVGPATDTRRSRRSSAAPHIGSCCSMLRAAALAAGLGPRLGLRLLSTAATQVVPSPNQQPEVFYNQVRPRAALFSPGNAARWVGSP